MAHNSNKNRNLLANLPMNRTLFILSLLFSLLPVVGFSQNLVPNPSFEDTVQCPFNEGQISFSTGWNSYGVSPDYYNNCHPSDWGLPNNVIGYQNANTGNAYIGIIAYDKGIPHTDKEFVGRQLSQNLTIGQKYYVSFKVSLPKKDTSTTNQIDCAVFACNKLGVLFTNTVYDEFNPPLDNNFAHVWTDSIITDTLNWISISGSFVSDSAYNNIVIGIFFDNSNVDTLRLFKPFCDVFAYYFIDDVCISSDSLTCNQPVSVNEIKIDQSLFNIFPNPATDYFTINNFSTDPYSLKIYNTLGQKVYEEKNISTNNKKINIHTFDFDRGILLINIISRNQSINYKLLKP